MADSEIRVGVVGTGSWANAGHMAVYDTHPGAKLIGVCDIDKDRALAALAAGKNVICEKPMAMNQAEAKKMLQAAADAGTKNGINFVYRNHPAARFARYLIEKGHLGRIFHVNAFYMQGWLVYPRVPVSWRLQKSMTGTGVLGDLGSHILTLTLNIIHTGMSQYSVGNLGGVALHQPVSGIQLNFPIRPLEILCLLFDTSTTNGWILIPPYKQYW